MHTPPTKVAIQGDVASFHEIAAHEYYQIPIELIYCRSFEDVFNALVSGNADRALVAVKNSSHGFIEEVSNLLNKNNVIVEGRYDLRIEQHLIGFANSKANDIKTIISHPVALSQCSLYIKNSLSNTRVQSFHDTAAAVAYIKELSDPSIAAIGSESAAQLYGMEIISRSIQNDSHNITTFQSLLVQK